MYFILRPGAYTNVSGGKAATSIIYSTTKSAVINAKWG
jgi:hypothetical protein